MNLFRLGASDEAWGLIYGPRCFLTCKQRMWQLPTVEVCQIKLFGHPMAVVAGCDYYKRRVKARGFRRCVVGYGQSNFGP